MQGFRRAARPVQSLVGVLNGWRRRLFRYCAPRLRLAAHRFAIMYSRVVKSAILSNALPFMVGQDSLVWFALNR